IPDARRGEDVAAFVVLTSPLPAEELLAHCRGRLASYKVPRRLWVRCEDALPTKGSGKVDKSQLRAEAARLTAADGPAGSRPGGSGGAAGSCGRRRRARTTDRRCRRARSAPPRG